MKKKLMHEIKPISFVHQRDSHFRQLIILQWVLMSLSIFIVTCTIYYREQPDFKGKTRNLEKKINETKSLQL